MDKERREMLKRKYGVDDSVINKIEAEEKATEKSSEKPKEKVKEK